MSTAWPLWLLVVMIVSGVLYGAVRIYVDPRNVPPAAMLIGVPLASAVPSLTLWAIVRLANIDNFAPSLVISDAAGVAAFVAVFMRCTGRANSTNGERALAAFFGIASVIISGCAGMLILAFTALGFHT